MDPFHIKGSVNGSNVTNVPPLEALQEPFQTLLAILYSLTAILALLGNVTGVTILVYGKRSSPELVKYLVNLATADILMSIFSIPFSYTDFMYGQWIFPPLLCPIVQFIQVSSVCVGIYTLIAIGLERYLL